MAIKNNNKLKNKTNEYQVKNALVNYFLVLMFTAFPLFFTAQYSKIRHDKLYFFLIAGIFLIAVESIILLFNIFSEKKSKIAEEKKWYQQLSFTDYSFGALMLCYIVSTIFSAYPMDSISGVQGRNNGLLLVGVYFGIYIIISRLFIYKEYLLPLIAYVSVVVYILCIINFFYIDPLGMFEGYNEKVQLDFTSTIGNKNLMASFCCITVPVFLMLFIHLEKTIRYLYLISAGVGFSALLCANSECGFLGLIPTLAVILIYVSRNYKRLSDFFISVAVMLICGKLTGLLTLIYPENKTFGTIQSFFVYNNLLYFIVSVCVGLSILFYFLERNNNIVPKILFYAIFSAVILFIIAIIGFTIYFTFIDTKTPLGAVTSYFRFSEKWGTHRGYIWIKSFEIFTESSFKDKLFGSGPDTFFSTFMPYFPELGEKYGNSSTNSAHNEFIHYLLTIGIAGVASYIALVISSIVRAFKNSKNNYLAVVFASAIICYLFQSIVNIAQPITTPFLFIFIALTEAICKKTNA